MAPISDDPPTQNDVWRGIHPWVRAVFMLGAPTVAAGWLIYLMSGSITGDLRDIRIQIAGLATQTSRLTENVSEDRGRTDGKLDILIRLAQTQCVNTASDVMQRRDCLNAGGK